MANSVDTGQTAPEGAVWPVFTLFAQAILSQYFNSVNMVNTYIFEHDPVEHVDSWHSRYTIRQVDHCIINLVLKESFKSCFCLFSLCVLYDTKSQRLSLLQHNLWIKRNTAKTPYHSCPKTEQSPIYYLLMCVFQGPAVKSFASLTSSLVVKMLTVQVSTVPNSQVFLLKNAKATHIFFFSKNISVYAIFNDQSFYNMLTNDIVSFEQLGPSFTLLAQPVLSQCLG